MLSGLYDQTFHIIKILLKAGIDYVEVIKYFISL